MTEDELREALPERDVDYLLERITADTVTVTKVGSEIHVVFKNYAFPPEPYTPAVANLLVRLVPPYPTLNPDMFWTFPDVKKTDGSWPQNCDVKQVPPSDDTSNFYQGVVWQRWSRHFDAAFWRPNIDGLRSYMASVASEIGKGR